MARLLKFEAEQADVLIAVREPGDAVVPVGVLDLVVKKIDGTVGDVLGIAAEVATAAHATLAVAPVDEAELEFGVHVSLNGKAYIVEGSSEGTFTVRLRLKLDRKP